MPESPRISNIEQFKGNTNLVEEGSQQQQARYQNKTFMDSPIIIPTFLYRDDQLENRDPNEPTLTASIQFLGKQATHDVPACLTPPNRLPSSFAGAHLPLVYVPHQQDQGSEAQLSGIDVLITPREQRFIHSIAVRDGLLAFLASYAVIIQPTFINLGYPITSLSRLTATGSMAALTGAMIYTLSGWMQSQALHAEKMKQL